MGWGGGDEVVYGIFRVLGDFFEEFGEGWGVLWCECVVVFVVLVSFLYWVVSWLARVLGDFVAESDEGWIELWCVEAVGLIGVWIVVLIILVLFLYTAESWKFIAIEASGPGLVLSM